MLRGFGVLGFWGFGPTNEPSFSPKDEGASNATVGKPTEPSFSGSVIASLGFQLELVAAEIEALQRARLVLGLARGRRWRRVRRRLAGRGRLAHAGTFEERPPRHDSFRIFVRHRVDEFPALLAEFVERGKKRSLSLRASKQ